MVTKSCLIYDILRHAWQQIIKTLKHVYENKHQYNYENKHQYNI